MASDRPITAATLEAALRRVLTPIERRLAAIETRLAAIERKV